MTPETHDLFRAVVTADASAVHQALAAGADVNATDELERNVLAYAALGSAINAIETVVQPRLTEKRLHVLQLVSQHPELSLYSLNTPLSWAGGVTLLGLMSWLNMPSEIMCLLDFTAGLVEVNAMDEQGATPLMYAARDGHLQVVQRLLAHGARPDLRDVSQRATTYYAVQHPQILWLCEQALRCSRKTKAAALMPRRRKVRPNTPFPSVQNDQQNLFFRQSDHLLTPPPATLFDSMEFRDVFEALLLAIHDDNVQAVRALLSTSPSRRHHMLSSRAASSGSFTGTPVLVNLRDETGLTPVHHAVSQRRLPNPAVIDALYKAGADVGLFSTLGFTPLHHLARTARDDADAVNNAHPGTSSATETHSLYAFTVHLIKDLQAPLGATDSRGETPLHAAAEHGRSAAVLRAMLDCDEEFCGKGAAGEVRNERGLRAVDVAKPEFLRLFQVGPQSRIPSIARPPMSINTKALPSFSQDCEPSAHNTPASAHPSPTSEDLIKKPSNTSLMSKSSGSSGSSGDRSSSSGRSYAGLSSSRRSPRRRASTPLQFFTTPPVPMAGFLPMQEPQSAIDVPKCTTDILYNLGFCASALHAYSQPHADTNSLPDLFALSDTLHFSRDLASHILDHWITRLETARSHFERTTRESEKVAGLLKRVGQSVDAASVRPPRGETFAEAFRLGETLGLSKLEVLPNIETQGDTPSSVAPDWSPSEPKARRRPPTRRKSSVTFEAREAHPPAPALPSPTSPAFSDIDERGGESSGSRPMATIASPNALKGASIILERGHRDLAQVHLILASINTSLKNSQQAISQAQALVEDAITLREERLLVVMRIYGHNHASHTSRLSPIEERSTDGGHTGRESAPVNVSLLSAADLEEPQLLRRLLTTCMQEFIEGMFEELKRAHVWSRIIREVLRGLHRRIFSS